MFPKAGSQQAGLPGLRFCQVTSPIRAWSLSLSLVLMLALMLTLGLPLIAWAAPVPEDQRSPLDLRRTTIVTGDTERSLAFYRDALGMQVIYDQPINTPREAASIEEAEIARRLVFLRANDDYIGVVGLLEYIKPRKEIVNLEGKAFQQGTTVLVFNHQDVAGAFERAKKIPGVVVISEPSETQYPSYDGKGSIRVLVSVLQDPDGIAVEINQVLEGM
jgi:catechol 2,3-dioxygenase-like lactoylglutathione lyase family enzyme